MIDSSQINDKLVDIVNYCKLRLSGVGALTVSLTGRSQLPVLMVIPSLGKPIIDVTDDSCGSENPPPRS